MYKAATFFVVPFLALPLLTSELRADGAPLEQESYSSYRSDKNFTGKVTRNCVRMRTQATLDSPVVRELSLGEMLLIVGETDDFYAVKPPSKTKAYVYRPYVLDGVVEGTKVNVRLHPHLEAPVVGQLNSGDRVHGTISEKNAKWLEIDPPSTTVFYVSSDYIEKVGDSSYLTRYEERETEVNNLLNATYILSEAEIQKHFTDIEADKIIQNYQTIINDYSDFPDQVKQAKKYLTNFNDTLLRKKVEFLESKSSALESNAANRERQLSARDQNERSVQQERTLPNQSNSKIYERWVNEKFASEVNARMALWIPVEIAYYQKWAENNDNRPIQEFYEEQKGHSIALRGVIESYDRPVRNKPGDFLLVNRANRLPIAYLYSTHVNLQDKIGQEVTIEGILRPNNQFAYPAYFVIGAQ